MMMYSSLPLPEAANYPKQRRGKCIKFWHRKQKTITLHITVRGRFSTGCQSWWLSHVLYNVYFCLVTKVSSRLLAFAAAGVCILEQYLVAWFCCAPHCLILSPPSCGCLIYHRPSINSEAPSCLAQGENQLNSSCIVLCLSNNTRAVVELQESHIVCFHKLPHCWETTEHSWSRCVPLLNSSVSLRRKEKPLPLPPIWPTTCRNICWCLRTIWQEKNAAGILEVQEIPFCQN